MSQDKFPLCKQLGVQVFGLSNPIIYAADVERMLAQAPVVYGRFINDYQADAFSADEYQGLDPREVDTHTARLLCIQEIRQDTAESLLRELVRAADRFPENVPHGQRAWLDRARKLLQTKENT